MGKNVKFVTYVKNNLIIKIIEQLKNIAISQINIEMPFIVFVTL